MKKFLVAILVILVAGVGLAVYAGWDLIGIYRATSLSTVPADLAKQGDSRVEIPAQHPLELRPRNPLKNVYWGELHVHTVESMDAVLMGTTATVEDAYRFARGAKFASPGGKLMQRWSHLADTHPISRNHYPGSSTRRRNDNIQH